MHFDINFILIRICVSLSIIYRIFSIIQKKKHVEKLDITFLA